MVGRGLKARDVTAWGEVPGKLRQTHCSALKGRAIGGASLVSAFQSSGVFVEPITRPFRPGYHRTGLRPCRNGGIYNSPLKALSKIAGSKAANSAAVSAYRRFSASS